VTGATRQFWAVMMAMVLGACSGAALTPDGGREAGAERPDAGKCVGDLATAGAGCPSMFDGTEANLPTCVAWTPNRTVWQCQDLYVLQLGHGLGGSVCYYDTTSHALVGAEEHSDIGVYCNQTSLSIEAGRTNGMCRENAPLFTRSCAPDAGSPTPDGGSCMGDMATIAMNCAVSFDGTQANLPMCPALTGLGRNQIAWQCQDLIALQFIYGLAGIVCYYDATSHALVGGELLSDSPSYCSGTSNSIAAGRTDPMCRRNAPLFRRDCVPRDLF
jgi:hypothetical protein